MSEVKKQKKRENRARQREKKKRWADLARGPRLDRLCCEKVLTLDRQEVHFCCRREAAPGEYLQEG